MIKCLFVSLEGVAGEERVKNRKNEKGKQSGAGQAADDDAGEGALDLGAGRGGKGHGEKTEGGDKCGHQYGAKALDAGLLDALQLIDGGDEDDAVEHGHAEEGDEADRSGKIEVHAAQPEHGDAADGGKGDGAKDKKALAERVECGVKQGEDEEDREGKNQGETLRGASLIFELATPIGPVAGGKSEGFF